MTRTGAGSTSTLPPATPEALNHCAAVGDFIAERIATAGGWLSFAEYMQHALYAPGLGYYSAGAAKFGAQGDFVTAPLISPLFSRVCAARMADWLRSSGTDEVLEFGPGTGRFAADALGVLAAGGSPLRRYRLLEVAADLCERQQRLLREFQQDTVALEWCDTLPQGFRGVMFANEILDALPAERFVVHRGEWWRLGVGMRAQAGLSAGDGDAVSDVVNDGRRKIFEWRVRPADGGCADDAAFTAEALRRREALAEFGVDLPDGYCGEWQPSIDAWFAALAAALERGVVLIADYGLPRRQLLHPDRTSGSLRCHYRHYAHGDPFFQPGLCDITTWVDFTSVAESAERAGFEVAGFTTQAAFLLGAGIEGELAAASGGIDPADPRYLALARGVRRLILPGEMGEAVKFMMLTRGIEAGSFDAEPAFRLQDLRASL